MSAVDAMEQVTDAARLIAFGLRPKLIPSRDLCYLELVKRFADTNRVRGREEGKHRKLGEALVAVHESVYQAPIPSFLHLLQVPYFLFHLA